MGEMRMAIDIGPVRAQLGRKVVEHDVATEMPLKCMAVTFGRTDAPPSPGEAVPPGWHWAWFPALTPRDAMGVDGLPVTGAVLPEMPLPRRMYAGGKLTFHDPVRVGDALTRETEFSDVQLREGATGTLIITTQTRRISTPRGLALTETMISVFREAVAEGAQSGIPKREEPPADVQWRRTITPDPVTLFRYSALTFNPHRIHYDRPYAMGEEGYPGLVVHGPFSQQCLLDLLRDNTEGRTILDFDLRARAPLFDTAPFSVVGRLADGGAAAELWAVTPQGTIAMQARARLG